MNPNINLVKGKNILVTCDKWFIAPDGKQYRAAWGKVAIHEDSSIMGIKTNDKSANWYAFVGDNAKGVLIAGCQIHFAVVCEEKPVTDPIKYQKVLESTGDVVENHLDTWIYIAQS